MDGLLDGSDHLRRQSGGCDADVLAKNIFHEFPFVYTREREIGSHI